MPPTQAAPLARLMLPPAADDKSTMPYPETEYAQLQELVARQRPRAQPAKSDSLFETRISAISRLALAARLESLVTTLREAQPECLQRALVEARTINETSFFRDDQPFEALRLHVLPRLIASRRADRRLRLWSAACSTGQEAYSLALLLVNGFPELADWDVQVIGTDVSARAVAVAQWGRYRRCETERGLPDRLRDRYFKHEGDSFQVCDAVRSLCEFHVADLAQPLPELPVFDLILLRNVLFYLPPAERSCVSETAHRQLWDRGFLMLGKAERAEDFTHLFKAEACLEAYFYRPIAAV